MHLEERNAFRAPAPSPVPPDEHPRPPVAPPCLMVIFGASGDLTKRKLIPALFNLRRSGLLPDQFAVLGVARQEMTDDELRQKVDDDISACDEPDDPGCRAWLLERVFYLAGDISQRDVYDRIAARAAELDAQYQIGGSHLYYLATAPTLFATVVQHLGAVGLAAETGDDFRRVIIEKPFGHDLESARELNAAAQPVLERTPDLSHRPLPRQGNRPEHLGVPLRQRHLRADLEPPLHRPRADHRAPKTSASRSAAAITTTPARCATWCRTTSSSSSR